MLFSQDGERFARRGYWGDIIVSPFVPLGMDSEEMSFFKKSNNVHTKVKSALSFNNHLTLCV